MYELKLIMTETLEKPKQERELQLQLRKDQHEQQKKQQVLQITTT